MDDRAPSGMIDGALTELRKVAGLEGVAILEVADEANGPVLLHEAGRGGPAIVSVARDLLRRGPSAPSHTVGADRRPILVCPCTLPSGRFGGVALWRPLGSRPWTAADHAFAGSVTSLLRVMLENTTAGPGLDRLTGLPNRHFFLEEVDRHIERLDYDQLTGTMMMIDLDGLRRVNALYGHDAGDNLLTRVAAMLRGTVRPTDIVARVGADEFGLWLDGMDHMTAAERADSLGHQPLSVSDPSHRGPEMPQTLSIGIATRRWGTGEEARTLLRRAHMAVREVKQTGGAMWRVSHVVPRAKN